MLTHLLRGTLLLCIRCIISCNEVFSCGDRDVSSDLSYCLCLKASVQHLPIFPYNELHKNPNFPTTLAATFGVKQSESRTLEIIVSKFCFLVGFGSTRSFF